MKTYGCIIADPPWRYRARHGTNAADNHYPTMPTKEIGALPVRQLAAPACVLLLWATWPKLPDALSVIDGWGFRYQTGFPWIKLQGPPTTTLFGETILTPQFGGGWWTRACSELVLIGTRGNVHVPESRSNLGLLSENFGHSRKPDNLYDYAEQIAGPHLEMFARRRRDGWDAWGNEIPGGIEMPR